MDLCRKENYRCHVCFKNVVGKAQGRSTTTTLCIRRPRQSLRQGSERRAVVLYQKIRNGGKIYATCTGYVRASETVVRCAVGTTESFKIKVGLWKMLFADDVVICEETKEEVERRLDCWRLERRGMKVSRSKIKYLCINGGNDDKTVKMKDKKSAKSKRI